MAHGRKALQHWDQWLATEPLAKQILSAEHRLLTHLIAKHFGKHALLIGTPHQFNLLRSSPIAYQSLLCPYVQNHQLNIQNYIEGELKELPILTGSLDLVVMAHCLEFVENPQHLIAEACRVIRPEGLIAICGFNPYSMWGMRKLLAKKRPAWAGHFLKPRQIKHWLQLADFVLEKQTATLFRPPLANMDFYDKLQFLDRLGNYCFPFLGGIYCLVARAKVIPLTPIKWKWTQRFDGIRISTTLPGNIASS